MLPYWFLVNIFQLTPSRRATEDPLRASIPFDISTHALTEGDVHHPCKDDRVKIFQLTPSRRATIQSLGNPKFSNISTHALTEGDSEGTDFRNGTAYFNSRPHGGRRQRQGMML